ncbi:hypothetical protein AB9P05_11455 [Roseivirga sp. BDSF3-8]|uniref:hypothetical protein n=1 Tax=Roseivirga sp. BDSF3-8 TaxID=3241598 RepID=UPI0035325D4F
MPIIENNPWIKGARGMAMKSIVYRQRGGKTIVSGRPAKSSKPPTEKQLRHRERFAKASDYAKMAMVHPILSAVYAAEADAMNSAYTMALKDYMKGPEISGLWLKDFHGRAGDKVGVYAEDNIGITSLKVSMVNEAGELLETGEAKEVVKNGYYEYTLRADLPTETRIRIEVEAGDLAGNVERRLMSEF